MNGEKSQNQNFEPSYHRGSIGVICLGFGLVAATIVLSVSGVKSAVNAIQASAFQDQMTYLQMMADLKASQNTETYAKQQETDIDETDVIKKDTSETIVEDESWSSPQLEWAIANHISWDENGNPVNEKGEIVDDPTTVVDERTRIVDMTNTVDDNTEITPVPATNWWDDIDIIQLDELNQPYYIIQSGDTLSALAAKTGFTVPEIADCNHITNANSLSVGQKILFPLDGPTVINKSTGLG